MDFGGIIKRSWQITWRYKALWVLGIFAGVSGCAGGSSGSGGGGNSGFSGSNSSDFADLERVWDQAQGFVPLVIGIGVLLFFIGILWFVFAIAARGGLITGVNAVEEGSERPLGELWRAGFGRFWTLLGLDIMLSLPLLIVGVLMAVVILVPVIGAIAADRDPGPAILAPVCGSLVIGFPLLLIGGFVFGNMRLIAQRYVMLGDQGAVESARNSWHFLRARLKDTAIMWLINGALNMAASFVLAIPAIVIGIAVAVPLVAAVAAEEYGALVAGIPVVIILFMLLGLAYNAVWGTYTSALWTLFFRDVSGMAVAVMAASMAPAMSVSSPAPYAPAPEPPVAPQPPPPAPPIAGYAPPPQPPAPEPAPPGDPAQPPASSDG